MLARQALGDAKLIAGASSPRFSGKADIYSKLNQKIITAWLGLRNDGAHGHYDKYTADQVSQMLTGITEFMTRVAL